MNVNLCNSRLSYKVHNDAGSSHLARLSTWASDSSGPRNTAVWTGDSAAVGQDKFYNTPAGRQDTVRLALVAWNMHRRTLQCSATKHSVGVDDRTYDSRYETNYAFCYRDWPYHFPNNQPHRTKMDGFYRKETNHFCCCFKLQYILRTFLAKYFKNISMKMATYKWNFCLTSKNIVSLFPRLCGIVIYFPRYMMCHPADILKVPTKNCAMSMEAKWNSTAQPWAKFCGTKGGNARRWTGIGPLVRALSLSLSLSTSFSSLAYV